MALAFWKPWSPRPTVLLSFAFVHQLSAVFIFVASFGFCLLDHKSNQKKTVHMRGPCCFEMVWNLIFFMFFPWSVSGCVWAAWAAAFGSRWVEALFRSYHSEPCSSICFCAANSSPYLDVMQHSADIGQLQQHATTDQQLSTKPSVSHWVILHILYSCISSHGLQSASSHEFSISSMTHSKYQGDPRGTTSVKQSEQLDLSGPFQVEASFSLCQLSLQVFDFLAKVLKGVDGFTLVSKGHKISKDV